MDRLTFSAEVPVNVVLIQLNQSMLLKTGSMRAEVTQLYTSENQTFLSHKDLNFRLSKIWKKVDGSPLIQCLLLLTELKAHKVMNV